MKKEETSETDVKDGIVRAYDFTHKLISKSVDLSLAHLEQEAGQFTWLAESPTRPVG